MRVCIIRMSEEQKKRERKRKQTTVVPWERSNFGQSCWYLHMYELGKSRDDRSVETFSRIRFLHGQGLGS